MEINLLIYIPNKLHINRCIEVPEDTGVYMLNDKCILYSEKTFTDFLKKHNPFGKIEILYDYYDNELEYIVGDIIINYTVVDYRKKIIQSLLK